MRALYLSAPLLAFTVATVVSAADPIMRKAPETAPVLSELPQTPPAQTVPLQTTPAPPQALPVSPTSVNMTSRPIDGSLGFNATSGNTQIGAQINLDPAKGQLNGIAVNIRVGPSN